MLLVMALLFAGSADPQRAARDRRSHEPVFPSCRCDKEISAQGRVHRGSGKSISAFLRIAKML
jgi:hypothetical protein